MTFGFHRRASVLGAKSVLGVNDGAVYDEERVFDRSAVIAVAIDARRKHFKNRKTVYVRAIFVGLEDQFRWNPETFDRVIKDYNLKDLGI